MARVATSFAVGLFFAATSFVSAADEPATVDVVGTTTKLFTPNVVRVRCRVFSEGATGGSAIKKLNASRSLLERKLKTKSASERTYAFGPVVEHQESQGGLQEIQMKAMQKMMGGGGQADEEEEKFIRLNFTLTLEWKMSGDNVDEHVRLMDAIRAELQSLGLDKADDKKEADADDDSEDDEEPAAEEAAKAESDRAQGVRVRLTHAPAFTYVRQLSDQELDAAAAEAFKDAQHRAMRFASAAGGKLGNMLKISSTGKADIEKYASDFERMSEMFGSSGVKFDEDGLKPDSEIISDSFKPIPFVFDVNVTFAIK